MEMDHFNLFIDLEKICPEILNEIKNYPKSF